MVLSTPLGDKRQNFPHSVSITGSACGSGVSYSDVRRMIFDVEDGSLAKKVGLEHCVVGAASGAGSASWCDLG